MRVLIVSDLHLGSPARIPTADSELCSLVLKEKWDRVILLGDVFDLWSNSYYAITRMHTTLLHALRACCCPVVFVPGNHDDAFRGVYQLDGFTVSWPLYEFEDNGSLVSCVHGDLLDDSWAGRTRIGACLVAAVDRFASWSAGPGVSVKRVVTHSIAEVAERREEYAIPLLEKTAMEVSGSVVVMGHTHTPIAKHVVGGKTAVNCGDFGPEHMTFVVVEDGVPSLHEVPAL